MVKLVKVKENKVAIALRNISNDTILFRLVNIKRSSTKAFKIFENVKYSTNLKNAFENNYRSIDYTYDTLSNNRLKNVNLLSKKALRSNLKDKYLNFTEIQIFLAIFSFGVLRAFHKFEWIRPPSFGGQSY